MAGDLVIPRCEVFWGDDNLTAYSLSESWPGVDTIQPLVYDVRVSLNESGQTPSGSMKWNPTGKAFAVYEKLIQKNYNKTITVRFYYLTGKSITFAFVWAGQTENYGQDMSIEVKLASELDGLILPNIKSIAQADEKGVSIKAAVAELEKFYGVDGLNLVQYYPGVEKDLQKPLIKSNYSEGSSFSAAIENVAQQNGNLVFMHNIKQPGSAGTGTGMVFYPPYTWEGSTYSGGDVKPNPGAPVSVTFPTPDLQYPDPLKRYGFFLGPAIINTITKTSEWAPPQVTQTYTINSQQKVQPRGDSDRNLPAPSGANTDEKENRRQAARTGGASGTSGSAARPNMRMDENEEGEKKKLILQEERTARLSASLFMCPALTGIKPCDIIFLPSYVGNYIEDWIVTSVEYEQSNGGVNLNVQAARKFAAGDLMHQSNGKLFKEIGTGVLFGDGATIENWVSYAWGMS